MAWSTNDMNWEGYQNDYHNHHMTDLSQAQAHPFPLVSPSHDWRWSGDARPASTSNWNAVSSSHDMVTASGNFHLNTPSSTNAANAISNSFDNPTPNPGLNYFPGTTPAFSSHVDRISPGNQSVNFPGQASHEDNIGNNEVSNRALGPQAYACLQATSKRSRKTQQYVFINLI